METKESLLLIKNESFPITSVSLSRDSTMLCYSNKNGSIYAYDLWQNKKIF